MKNRQIVFGVVGIAIGFVLGFFTSDVVKKNEAPQATPAAQQDSSQLPQDHPSMEDMRRLQEMQQKAAADPQDRQLRIALGNAYYDMRRFDAAIPWYEEAVKLDPSNIGVITDLGTCYLYSNNPSKAIELYQKSLALDPKHPQTLQNLGFAYFATTDFAKAVETWNRLLTLYPEYPHKEDIGKQIEAAKVHLRSADGREQGQPKTGVPPEKTQ